MSRDERDNKGLTPAEVDQLMMPFGGMQNAFTCIARVRAEGEFPIGLDASGDAAGAEGLIGARIFGLEVGLRVDLSVGTFGIRTSGAYYVFDLTGKQIAQEVTGLMTVVEFLLARIAEDEATARDSATVLLIADTAHISRLIKAAGGHEVEEERTLRHFDQWKPKRVLAECEAKRALVELYRVWDGDANDYGQMEGVMMILARVWSDHPDFDPAWAES